MARREVVEITCDRCSRTETQAPGTVPKRDGMVHEFTVNFHGQQMQYEDLCRRCRNTLSNYYDKIIKASKDEDEKEAPAPETKAAAPNPPPKAGLFSRSKAAG